MIPVVWSISAHHDWTSILLTVRVGLNGSFATRGMRALSIFKTMFTSKRWRFFAHRLNGMSRYRSNDTTDGRLVADCQRIIPGTPVPEP